jgi:hypothetical protein
MRARPHALYTVTLFALVVTTLACGDNRGGDVPAIRASLERLPGVRVIDVVGWDEMWPVFGPEDIRASLQIEEHGVLILRDLSTSGFSGNGSFWIDQIGNWAPKVAMVDDQGRQRFIDGCYQCAKVAHGSAFLELLPFPIGATPADVVTNYTRLNTLIATWPDHPRLIPSKDGSGHIEYWKETVRE